MDAQDKIAIRNGNTMEGGERDFTSQHEMPGHILATREIDPTQEWLERMARRRRYKDEWTPGY